MENNILAGHIQAIKKATEEGEFKITKPISIEMLNLENFKFKLNNENGIVNVAELVIINEFIEDILTNCAFATSNIIILDKNSPKYWGNIEKEIYEDTDKDGKVKKRTYYSVSVDLEIFMKEFSDKKEVYPGYYIPDNYSLADKVLNDFKNSGNNIKGIEKNHYRECANWEIKTKKQAQKLVDFIQKTYVEKKIKEIKKFGKIKNIIYMENKFEFELE